MRRHILHQHLTLAEGRRAVGPAGIGRASTPLTHLRAVRLELSIKMGMGADFTPGTEEDQSRWTRTGTNLPSLRPMSSRKHGLGLTGTMTLRQAFAGWHYSKCEGLPIAEIGRFGKMQFKGVSFTMGKQHRTAYYKVKNKQRMVEC